VSEVPLEASSPPASPAAGRDADAEVLAESGRVEAFSDGVLAIVITLLVLDLRAPDTRGVMLQQLLHQWPAYVAYLASFAYVGVIWVNHHKLFTRIAGVDTGLLWRNLALLLTTSVLPFPTAVLGSAFQRGSQRDQTVGLVFYALVSAAMAATWLALFHYLATNERLLASNTTGAFFARERRRALSGIATYLVAGLVAPVGAGRRIDRRRDAACLLRGDQRRPASNAPSQDITTNPGVAAMTATGTLEAGRGLAPKSARGPCCSPP
jgi:uncharacterized membrane protein